MYTCTPWHLSGQAIALLALEWQDYGIYEGQLCQGDQAHPHSLSER